MKVVPLSPDQINQQIAEARQLSIAAPIILPMLERRKLMAYQKVLGAHRGAKPPDANAIAEMSVIEQIQSEIREKLESLNFIPKENV